MTIRKAGHTDYVMQRMVFAGVDNKLEKIYLKSLDKEMSKRFTDLTIRTVPKTAHILINDKPEERSS